MECIFCKIVKGEIPSEKIYEDEKVLAFYDVRPQAPVHFLVIPKEHFRNFRDISADKMEIVSHIFKVIQIISEQLHLEGGFRIVNNCGQDGGQTVDHLHFHILAGRRLNWPPG